MILVRTVFQAKVGRAAEVAQGMAEGLRGGGEALGIESRVRAWRVLTDLSGPFDTVVLEVEVDSLAAWEQQRKELFASPVWQAGFAGTAELVVSGRNELYTLEAQG